MADGKIGEEGEDVVTKITSLYTKTMIEWDRIQSPSTVVSDPLNGGWSMVKTPQIVFPPVNHEGLDHISSGSSSPHHEDVKENIHLESPLPLPPASPHVDDDVKEIQLERVVPPQSPLPTQRPVVSAAGDVTGGWWEAGLQLLCFKVVRVVSTFRKFVETGGFQKQIRSRISYFGPLAGSIMLLLLYLRYRRRRRESIADLIRFVKEKDEEKLQKINELVHQVARMNELLLALSARHIPKPA